MSEEKRLILKMLKEDKITEDEALKLLEAIGDKEANFKEESAKKAEERQANFNFDSEKFEKRVEGFAERLVSGVDKIVRKAGEALQGIELGYDFDMSYEGEEMLSFSKLKSQTDRTFVIDLDQEKQYKLEVENRNGKIEIAKWDMPQIQVNAQIKFNSKYMDEDYEFVKYNLADDRVKIYADTASTGKQSFVADLLIYLPEREFEKLTVGSTNGKVGLDDANIKEVEIETVNGSISAYKLLSNNLFLNTVNGSIILEEAKSNKSNVETVNGKIQMLDSQAKEIKASTVNGKLELEGINAEVLDLSTVSGKIYIEGDFEETKKINASTVNGKIEACLNDKEIPARIVLNGQSRILDRVDLGESFKLLERDKKQMTFITRSYQLDKEGQLEISFETVNGRFEIEA